MKILVFSDLHDEELALERLAKLKSSSKFDIIINCGDITRNSISFAEDVLSIFPDAFTVPGNNESEEVKEIMKKGNYVHEKRIELSQFNIVGFGYSNITPFGTLNEYSEEEIFKRMSKLRIDNNTLLVCHCPPYGYFDNVRGKNIGSISILKIIEEKQPFAVFCGHIHEYSGLKQIGNAYLVKVPAAVNGKAAIAEIKDKKPSAEFIDLVIW